MNEKEREKVRKDIGDVFDNWMTILKLNGYDYYVLFPEDEGWEQADTGGMSVKLKYPYKAIYLNIPQENIDNYKVKKDNIADSLLHEATHVLLWRFSHLAHSRWGTFNELDNCEEELTDHITHVISALVENTKRV